MSEAGPGGPRLRRFSERDTRSSSELFGFRSPTIGYMADTIVDMSRTITQRELRNDSARILKAAEQGEEFTVTRNGTPIARLVPLGEPDHRFVTKEQMDRGLAGMPQIDYQQMRTDLEEFIDMEPRDPYERHRG